jgi:gamma-glutamyltranspeptidase/glutathione hydrolase
MDEGVVAELGRRGHRMQRSGPWDQGRLLAGTHAEGRFEAAASPRFQVAYAAVLP